MSEEGTAIAKLDLSDAAEQLKDKIKFAFAETIPDEQWEAMIQAELKKFIEPKVTYSGYNNRDKRVGPSEFSATAQEVLAEHMNEQLHERIKAGNFLPEGETLQALINTWLDENRAAMLDMFLEGLMRQVTGVAMSAMAQVFTSSIQVALTDPMRPGIPDPTRPGYDTQGNYIG